MSNQEKKKSLGGKVASGCMSSLLYNLMALVYMAFNAAVILIGVLEIGSFMKPTLALSLGIALSIIFALVIFRTKLFRKVFLLKLLAICTLIDAGWWTYMLITD